MYVTRITGKCVGSYGSYNHDFESASDMYNYGSLKFIEDVDPCNFGSFYEYIWPEDLKALFSESKSYFEYDEENHRLLIVVEYLSKDLPTPQLAKDITEYTQGQFSDGIGEGFEQFPIPYDDGFEDLEFYISMWHQGQKLVTTLHKTDEQTKKIR